LPNWVIYGVKILLCVQQESDNGKQMLNVVITATRRGESAWTPVANGTWVPGEAPQLNTKTLPSTLIQELFSVAVGPDETSGRSTAEFLEFSYAMEWQR